MPRLALILPLCAALAACGADGDPFVPGAPQTTAPPSSELGPVSAAPAGTLQGDDAGDL